MVATTEIQASHIKSHLDGQLEQLKRRIAGRLEQGFYSRLRRYGLSRDLGRKFEWPQAKIPLFIRPLAAGDLDTLLPLGEDIPAAEQQEIIWRRHFYKNIPNGCFVAVDQRDDTPCYMQWLIGSRENKLLARFKCFPKLADNEALLEQAYTIPSHRGLGIMSVAMAMIAERASDMNANHVLTFVSEDGIASLKACRRAGFHPHLLHRRTQIGYGAIVYNSFRKLTMDDPRRNMVF